MDETHPLQVGETARRFGGHNVYDFLLRLLGLLDQGRKDLLRKKFVDMLGIRHLDDTEQERMLLKNKAYQKSLSELEAAIDQDKRFVRDVFERAAGAGPAPSPKPAPSHGRLPHDGHLDQRRSRLRRLRTAQARKLKGIAEEYEKKKRLYDARFESIEQDAYAKGQSRIEEDRKRYESLSAEFEAKLKQEQAAIAQAQDALSRIESMREEAEKEMAAAKDAEEHIKRRINDIVAQFKATIPGLEALSAMLGAPRKQEGA